MKIKPNFKRYLLNALVAVAFVIVTSLLSGNIRLSIIIPLSKPIKQHPPFYLYLMFHNNYL